MSAPCPQSFQLEAQISSWTSHCQCLQELLQVEWWIRQLSDHSRQLWTRPRAAPFLGWGMKNEIFWAEDEAPLQPPGGLGTTLLAGDAEHVQHTLHPSAWICSWQKWDYPWVECKDKNVTGFEGKQLCPNQRLALQGWGSSAGAVSGSRKELLIPVPSPGGHCSKVNSLASHKTHLLWQFSATASWSFLISNNTTLQCIRPLAAVFIL